MKIFFLDLVQDLRSKRLMPVAVVLAVALVAVPVVLSKPAKTTAPRPIQAARSAPDPKDLKALASVKLATTDSERGSSLDTFDPAHPLRPPKKVTQKKKETSDAPSTAAGNATSGSPTGETGTGAPSSGETGSTGGGTTGGGTGGGSAPTQAVQYRYVVDVTFITNGHARHIKGLERLD